MNYYKPKLKKILTVNEQTIKNYKFFNFKKKKWQKFINFYKLNFINKKHYKFKLIDQKKNLLNYYSTKFSSYKNNYKHSIIYNKIFKFLYQSIMKINNTKNFKQNTIFNFLENRLDIILLKSKYYLTIRATHYAIKTGYIFINDIKTKKKSFIVKSGYFIKVINCLINYNKFLIYCFKWVLPFSNYMINYVTKELVYFNNMKIENFTLEFPNYLYINKLFN